VNEGFKSFHAKIEENAGDLVQNSSRAQLSYDWEDSRIRLRSGKFEYQTQLYCDS
jgi:hypothetical protein